MVLCLFLLFLLPIATSLPTSTCPPQAKLVFDQAGGHSCVCLEGFAGPKCEILLCHDYFCFGRLSVCENTLQGPLCHCERGRAGSNCERLKGESTPWSRCVNNTFCEKSFQNGICDQMCNNAECLYDGNDCQMTESSEEVIDPMLLIDNQDSPSPIDDSPYTSIPIEHLLIIFSSLLILIIILLVVIIHRIPKHTSRVVNAYPVPPNFSIPSTPGNGYSEYGDEQDRNSGEYEPAWA